MQQMMDLMNKACFDKCVGTTVSLESVLEWVLW
jgi:hypothetical protein